MVRSVRCSLPPRIAHRTWTAPPTTADFVSRVTERLTGLDRRLGDRTATFDLLARTEAVSSSRIEDEHATLDDYARALVGIRANGSATAMVGATAALRAMIDDVGRGGITERSVLDAHAVLMRDDPVDGPVAGRWRQVQNWIGGGASPRDAAYVPPPADDVAEAMDDLFAFLSRDDLDPIVQAAIAHAQFESVHPFTDGNGRIGRALVNAVLRRRGLTSSLVVPVAAALVADRAGYFAELVRYRDGHVDGVVTLVAAAIGTVCDEVEYAALRLDEIEHDRAAVHSTSCGPGGDARLRGAPRPARGPGPDRGGDQCRAAAGPALDGRGDRRPGRRGRAAAGHRAATGPCMGGVGRAGGARRARGTHPGGRGAVDLGGRAGGLGGGCRGGGRSGGAGPVLHAERIGWAG